MPQKHAQGRMS